MALGPGRTMVNIDVVVLRFAQICKVVILVQRVCFLRLARFDPCSQAGQEIAHLMAQFALLFSAKAQLNPKSVRETFLFSRPSDALLSDSFWQGLVHYMALTSNQQLQLHQSWVCTSGTSA